jgi:uncharacterized protein (TIGR02421 family)
MPIDEIIKRAGNSIRVLRYMMPINFESARELFLTGQDPIFQWNETDYDTEAMARELESIIIPEEMEKEIAWMYKEYIELLKLQNEMISHRGNKETIRELSKQIYGIISPRDRIIAERILNEYRPRQISLFFPADKMKEQMETEIRRMGLVGFEVEYDDSREFITINPIEKNVSLHPQRKYSLSDYFRLSVHEVGTHAVRVHNGSLQPYPLFCTGFAHYEETEEGLGAFSEMISGTLDTNTLRLYAGGLMAAHSVDEGDSFSDTHRIIKDRGFADDDSWMLTSRAHGGGGLIMDHIYLSGLQKVTEYAASNNNMDLMYVGRVALHHAPLISEMIMKRVIFPPKVIPQHITAYNSQRNLIRILLET